MTPTADIANAIRAHAREFPTVEVCGLVFDGPGRKTTIVRRCANVATNPRADFAIDVREYEAAEREAGTPPSMVYHSHPFTGPKLTVVDEQWSNRCGIPYLLYCLGTDTFALHEPDGEELPYEGRPFAWGVLDCWALAHTWYKRERGLDLRDLPRGPRFWQEADLFLDNLPDMGFTPVPFGEWRAGDLLLFAININDADGKPLNPEHRANHCGVLVDEDCTLLLHHLEGRKSRVEPFNNQRSPWFPHLYRHPSQSAWRPPAAS